MSTDRSKNSPVQLGLGIESAKEAPGVESTNPAGKPDGDDVASTLPAGLTLSASSALVVAGFFLLVTALLINNSQNPEDGSSIPENFLVEDLSPARPMDRHFPEFEFPTGEVLQLGLFARLEGAENHQTELTGLGLSPHIEKRVTNNSVQYAVVLGPLDAEDHQSAVKTLKENQLQFFHRQRRDS